MNKLVRSVGIMSAAVAFGAGSALVAPMAVAQSSLPGSSAPDTCGESVVTPSGLAAAGWGTPTDETPATIAAVTGADPKTVGDAALTFGAQVKPGVSLYKDAKNAPLSSLIVDGKPINLSYDYVSSGQAPALQIRITGASLPATDFNTEKGGFDTGFATIVHSPVNTEGAWKTANAGEKSEYFVSRDLGTVENPVTSGTPMTLKRIVELNPTAKITAYGVQKTRENEATNVAIDNFTFGCEVTDFELDPKDGGIFGSVSGIFQS